MNYLSRLGSKTYFETYTSRTIPTKFCSFYVFLTHFGILTAGYWHWSCVSRRTTFAVHHLSPNFDLPDLKFTAAKNIKSYKH